MSKGGHASNNPYQFSQSTKGKGSTRPSLSYSGKGSSSTYSFQSHEDNNPSFNQSSNNSTFTHPTFPSSDPYPEESRSAMQTTLITWVLPSYLLDPFYQKFETNGWLNYDGAIQFALCFVYHLFPLMVRTAHQSFNKFVARPSIDFTKQVIHYKQKNQDARTTTLSKRMP